MRGEGRLREAMREGKGGGKGGYEREGRGREGKGGEGRL
jgi:hypothetical protein